MRYSVACVLPLLPLTVLAGKFHDFTPRSRHAGHARSVEARNNISPSNFTMTDLYTGQSFLDDWDFFTGEDPTHGNVNYQTREDALAKGLAFVQEDGTTVLKVDDFSNVPVGGNRDSVRISSKKTYNGGLFIADFWSMPHGCSVWPAYWSVGPNWPSAGEIDVLEGVHEQEANQYTLHTSPGCEIGANFNEASALSSILNDQCSSSGTDNRGCGFRDPDSQTYGHAFNILAGGVYAHLWDSTGIRIWRFLRPSIPADITAKTPNPATWGTPAAFFPATNCDMASHFFEHQLVLDTSICGDFGGPTYAGSGCPGTCAQAVANATNFRFAKWQLNYIAVYN